VVVDCEHRNIPSARLAMTANAIIKDTKIFTLKSVLLNDLLG
jgi:hypothetical protein